MTLDYDPPQLIKHRMSYQGRKFGFDVNYLKLPNGAEGEWECIRHPGGSLVIPVTADGRLILLKQYRFALQGRLIEFPAGTIEHGEDPLETVKREIQEETGYTAHDWRSLGKFSLAPGYSDEYIYVFIAYDLEKLPDPPQQDEDEDTKLLFMTPEELEEDIRNGLSVDAKTIASFFLARPFL
jgi:ADP-ribose pyrophosphatase